MRIAVIGAGIVGLATAWTLREAGHEVVVIDRESGPARGASGRNGAQLSYAFVQPLASPSTLVQAPALLLSPRSPLRLRPGLSPRAWAWLCRFAWACRPGQAERGTRTLLDLAARSREHFAHWRSQVDAASIGFARNGKLVIHRSEASWRAALRQMAMQAPIGPRQVAMDPRECLRIEPALDAVTDFRGGIFTPDEEVADCEAVCEALRTQLCGRGGVAWRWNTHALGWHRAGREVRGLWLRDAAEDFMLDADAFVVANGVEAPRLLAPLGADVPIAALKGYSIELPAAALARMPRVSITDQAAKTVFAPLGAGAHARLRVAGMAELVGEDRRIAATRIEQLLVATERVFGPVERPRDLRPWAGLRPAVPDGLPRIGRAGAHARVFVNAGHGALGFTLAFGSAAVLLQAIEGRRCAAPMSSSWSRPLLEGDR